MTQNAASFDGSPEQEKAQQQVRLVQVAMPHGPYDLAEPAVFEVSVGKDVYGAYNEA